MCCWCNFFVSCFFKQELRSIKWFDQISMREPDLIKYLDLVSLGTVCDVVPLIGLNSFS